jgi:ring-1,2-phenylacetyl-CoA epoxidase subunit PaaC
VSGHDESVYDGLLADDAHWAFGGDFDAAADDPLAGVDTSVPDDVDPAALAAYCLMLGDDALVLSQRLAEWSSRAPDLEQDVMLTNVALDLLGQARLLLARAAAASPEVVPVLPDGSPVPDEDRLAFFRDDHAFRNARLVELPNGDFAETMARLLLFSVHRLAVLAALRSSRDAVLAALAAKGVKEVAYHRDVAAQWCVTLAQGTEESRRRLVAALDGRWPWWPELVAPHPVCAALDGVAVDPSSVAAECEEVLAQVLSACDLVRPEVPGAGGVHGRTGRDGAHTEALSQVLAEMQVVARAHPMGQW